MQVRGLIAYRQTGTAEAQTLIAGDLSVRWDLLADAAKSPLVWKERDKPSVFIVGSIVTLRMSGSTLLTSRMM